MGGDDREEMPGQNKSKNLEKEAKDEELEAPPAWERDELHTTETIVDISRRV